MEHGRDFHRWRDGRIDQGRRHCHGHHRPRVLGVQRPGRCDRSQRSVDLQVFDLARTGVTGNLITAREAGLIACQRLRACARRGMKDAVRAVAAHLQSRDTNSSQRVWALAVCRIGRCLCPPTILPMLRTATLVENSESTIVGGVVELIHHGSYGIARNCVYRLDRDPGGQIYRHRLSCDFECSADRNSTSISATASTRWSNLLAAGR